ncbi:conserved hypothetical protein [Mycoplasmopsis pulmonis]|uniref:Lysylphosphatidylglycerol synthase n=1 Tax=Mycoplasmopsis pulmonis (strain UAB CTIP) TaxID=272635 RepID=Q98Q82_MYCPU|nr:lysylphosphatidylglycerol synthase domain-containing protein [Mycoplasmopsis pulmonis]MDZ7293506.1 YbhN family protein [Mycoplasmopsis pulmonis]CAC13657.1 conserved hypothetical protein [Mycoplasmopsis pulmonis]VEU68250.1 Uncharacterised protein [Mycoplasmopsis pulmonis]
MEIFTNNLEFQNNELILPKVKKNFKLVEKFLELSITSFNNFLKSKKDYKKLFISNVGTNLTKDVQKKLLKNLNFSDGEIWTFKENVVLNKQQFNKIFKKMNYDFGIFIDKKSHNENLAFAFFQKEKGQMSQEEIKKIFDDFYDQKKQENENIKNVFYLDKNFFNSILISPKFLDDFKHKNDFSTFSSAASFIRTNDLLILEFIKDTLGINLKISKNKNDKFLKDISFDWSHSWKELVNSLKVLVENNPLSFVLNDGKIENMVVVYKTKKRIITGQELAALYLEYQAQILTKNQLKDSYIIVSSLTSNFLIEIAKKHGIEVIRKKSILEENKSQNNWTYKSNFIFAYENNYDFIFEENQSSLNITLTLLKIYEMLNFFKNTSTNIYKKLTEIHSQSYYYRYQKIEKKISSQAIDVFCREARKIETIGDEKIIRLEEIKTKNNLIFYKFTTINNNWFAFQIKKDEPDNLVVISEAKAPLLKDNPEVLIFEKKVQSFVNKNTEIITSKAFEKKDIYKFSFFSIVLIIVMYLVFTQIYSENSNDIFKISISEIKKVNLGFIVLLWTSTIFALLMQSIWRKRIISYQKVKVSLGHFMIGNLMGMVISLITPFAIGGDVIVYWYLRRKGLSRDVLLSSLFTSTIIYQISILVSSIIFFAIGYNIYALVFKTNTLLSVFFISGLAWSLLSTAIFLIFTLNKSIQNFFVSWITRIIELIPFIILKDPLASQIKIEYEFFQIRRSFKNIWKNTFLIIEGLFYEIFPKFVSGIAVFALVLGYIKNDLSIGPYLSFVITQNMILTANTLSISPGGSGSAEYLAINIYDFILNKPNSHSKATVIDFINKAFNLWPFILLSIMTIITISVGERRKDKVEGINKNNFLKNVDTIKKNNYWIYALWTLIPLNALIFGFVLLLPYIF